MGDKNQLAYIQKFEKEFKGPYLEIGSKDYGAVQIIRPIFEGRDEYVGIDMQAGNGVDIVLDLTDEFDNIEDKLDGRRFGTIFCMSVMEHCDQPFRMAENLTKLLKPGGKLCISVPFAWKYHGFPSDYWRFTPQGVEKLFPELEFNSVYSLVSTSKEFEMYKPDSEIGKINFSFKKQIKKRLFFRAISVKTLRIMSKIGFLKWLVDYRYLLTPTMINMIGKLPE